MMIFVCCVFAYWLFAFFWCFWDQSKELKSTKRELALVRDAFWSLNARHEQLETDLKSAEKQLVALEGQTPGRDRTGRFVKRQKETNLKK